jgi:tetratricopeptide (TPR) repeat protein
MSWDRTLTNLRDVLAHLYPTEAVSRQIVDMSDVPPGRIEFSAAATSNWHNILREGHKHDSVGAIIAIAQHEYPKYEELTRAGQAYLDRRHRAETAAGSHGLRLAAEDRPRIEAKIRADLDTLLNRHTLFGGRESELDLLDQFVGQGSKGYCFLTGRSGFGKTALLANWVQDPGQDSRHVCYHFINRIEGMAGEDTTLRNLCQQLTAYHDLRGELPASVAELRALYRLLLAIPPDEEEKLVVVLDGLDERTDWSLGLHLLFPHETPEGVFVVFSARRVSDVDWLEMLELAGEQVEEIELETMGIQEIANLLRKAGDQAVAFSEDTDFVAAVHRVSQGDPFYLHSLVQDILQSKITAANIDQQPKGLDRYLGRWWQEVSEAATNKAVQDLLGYLLVAKGPLPRASLVDISADDALNSWVFDATLGKVQRYVVGERESGYVLSHPRFQDYLAREQIREADQRPYRQSLLAYCARWREHKHPYALRYYAEHLYDEHKLADLYLLIDEPWKDAQFERVYSHRAFADDVELAIHAALKETPPDLAQVIRNSLIYATLGSLATSVPPLALRALAQLGQTEKALGYAALNQHPQHRSRAYVFIAEAMLEQDQTKNDNVPDPEAVLDLSLNAAEGAGDRWARPAALSDVAVMLARIGKRERAVDVAERALALATASGYEAAQAEAIRGLAHAEEYDRARDLASQVGDEKERAAALRSVVRAMAKAGQLERAMKLESTVDSPEHRDRTRCTLALCLARQRGFDGAMVEAQAIETGHFKVAALSGISQSLMRNGQKDRAVETAGVAYAAAHHIEEAWSRAEALSQVSQAFARIGDMDRAHDAAMQAQQAAEELRSRKGLIDALSSVALAYEAGGHPKKALHTIERALRISESVDDEPDKASAIGAVACALAQAGLHDRALSVVETIDDANAKEKALGAIAGTLARAGEADLAQEVAAEIEDLRSNGRALGAVALALARDGDVDRATKLAGSIGDVWSRCRALGGVALSLAEAGDTGTSGKLVDDALLSCADLSDIGFRVSATTGVVPALVAAGRTDRATQVRDEALHLIGTIDVDWSRYRALCYVAQDLADSSDKAGLDRVLDLANGIAEERSKAKALAGIAPALAQVHDKPALYRGLAAAESIEDTALRVEALGGVAHGLGQAGEVIGLDKIVNIAEKVNNAKYASKLVGAIAYALARAGEYDRAIELAQSMGNDRWKSRALARVAQAISMDVIESPTLLTGSLRQTLVAAFSTARLVDRSLVFWLLKQSATPIAVLEQGEGLWKVYRLIMDLEAWWGDETTEQA